MTCWKLAYGTHVWKLIVESSFKAVACGCVSGGSNQGFSKAIQGGCISKAMFQEGVSSGHGEKIKFTRIYIYLKG